MIYEEVRSSLVCIVMEGVTGIVTNNKIPASAAYNKIKYIFPKLYFIINILLKNIFVIYKAFIFQCF